MNSSPGMMNGNYISNILPPPRPATMRKLALHALCWLLFMGYEIGFIYLTTHRLGSPAGYVIYYAMNSCFFYSHIPLLSYVFERPVPLYMQGIVRYLLLLAFFLCLKSGIDYLQAPVTDPEVRGRYARAFVPYNLYRALNFTILATFYWAAGHIGYFRKRSEEAEKRKMLALAEKAETDARLASVSNAYLRQQINPHLLFNALAFVYSKVEEHSQEGACCIHLLSELMRFSLLGADADGKIAVISETAQLQNLLEINQYRFNGQLHVNLELGEGLAGHRIIPLVLLTLTENVFKHGLLLDASRPATVRCHIDDAGYFCFYTKNAKRRQSSLNKHKGTGVENIRIRLDFSYGSRYRLDIEEDADFYQTNLRIAL